MRVVGGFKRRALRTLLERLTSMPLVVKLLGIGAVAAIVFGTITLWYARQGTTRILQQLLELRSLSLARSLADTLERPLTIGERVEIMQVTRAARKRSSDLRYVIVRDTEGEIVGHTFEHSVPLDLRDRPSHGDVLDGDLRVYDSGEGRIFDVLVPVQGGESGTVEVGLTDAVVAAELRAVAASILWGLGVSAVLGIGLAFLLSCVIVRPVRHLQDVTREIRSGKFEARASRFFADEIGDLAQTINEMAASLERYRAQVEAKEKDRQALLEKVVSAQEEERKTIARELHDHVGQSLLAVLLAVQSSCKYGDMSGTVCQEIEDRLRGLAGDVHRMAWGMRPAVLDDYGLESALQRFIAETRENTGLEIHYEFTGPEEGKRLPRHIELALYRVCQEAVANIIRHAQAGEASIVLLHRHDEVTLIVEDDGRGFVADAETTASSLGIVGMRERVALLDGICAIESAPGSGTTLRARIPLDRMSAP